MSVPGPSQPLAWAGRVTLADLLLFLIINLAALRLAGLWVGSLIAAARGGRAEDGETLALVVTLSLILFQAIVLLVSLRALILRRHGLVWADLGLRPCARAWYRRAFVLALVLLPVVAAINAAIPRVLEEPFRNPQVAALAPAGFSWPALIGMTIMGGIVAPFVEELAFRGLLYNWLRARMSYPAATLVSATCFALLHGVAQLIPALFAIGLALAWLTERCGSLWPAIVTHGAFNIFMILALYAALAAGVGPG